MHLDSGTRCGWSPTQPSDTDVAGLFALKWAFVFVRLARVITELVTFAAGVVVGGAAVAFFSRQKLQAAVEKAKAEGHIERLAELKSESERRAAAEARLEAERTAAEEKLGLLNEAKQRLTDAFNALSSDALKSNNEAFLQLARTHLEKFQQGAQTDLTARQKAIDELVKPLKESLQKVDLKIGEIEKERTSAYPSLTQQLKSLATTQVQLQGETAKLVGALRAPNVRGRWGEIQLKRVVEMAGMLERCDFIQQDSINT